MLVEREVLEDKIRKVLVTYNHDKNVKKNIENQFLAHNINMSQAIKILNQIIPIESLSMQKLYLLTKALYDSTEESIIKPDKFFNENEMSLGSLYEEESEKLKDDFHEFKNVQQIADDMWLCIIDYKENTDVYKKGLIGYNFATQRESIKVEYKNKIIEKPNINRNSVREIKELMLKGLFISNVITYNVMDANDFNYNDKNKTLQMKSADVIDGFHRNIACIEAISENPNLEGKFVLFITNFNIDKARRYILQEDKRNPINARYKSSIDTEKFENVIVKNINEKSDSELQGKIATDIVMLNKNYAYVLNDVLSYSITHNFERIRSRREADKVTDFLIKSFNEIIGIYYDEFDNLEQSKKETVVVYNSMFSAYIAILSELYDKENWKEILEKVLNNIDADINNELYNKDNLDIFSNTLGKVKMKKISKHFKTLVKECI